MPICPNCGNKTADNAIFCDQCGTRLPIEEPALAEAPTTQAEIGAPIGGVPEGVVICANCGAENVPGEVFCDNCGEPLELPEPVPVELIVEEEPAVPEEAIEPIIEEEPVAVEEVEPIIEEEPVVVEEAAPIAEEEPIAIAEAEPTIEEEPIAIAEVEPTIEDEVIVEEEAGLYCPACGAEIHVGDTFCGNCGASLGEVPPEQEVVPEEPIVGEVIVEEPAEEIIVEEVVVEEPFEQVIVEEVEIEQEPIEEIVIEEEPAAETIIEEAVSEQVPLEATIVQEAIVEEEVILEPAEAEEESNCSVCGASVLSDQVFCASCGAALQTPAAAAAAPEPVVAEPVAPQGPYIEIVDSGAQIPLVEQAELLIGRLDEISGISPDIDMTPHRGEEGGVSRRHARLIHEGGNWFILDLDSTNGTYVNGLELQPKTRHALNDGDNLSLGDVEVILHTG